MHSKPGPKDLPLDIILGIAIGTIGLIAQSRLGLIGLVPLMTGLKSFSPVSPPLGISTCSNRRQGS